MREELDNKLCEKYPLIFKDRHGDPKDTLMCFGFEVGDGWYNIIDILCGLLYSEYSQAEARYERTLEVGVGGTLYGTTILTQEKLDELKANMDNAASKIPVAVQVKEKFGGLRFYVEKSNQQAQNYITFAESMSYRTCEVCGKPGNLYTDGWHTVLCTEHHEQRKKS